MSEHRAPFIHEIKPGEDHTLIATLPAGARVVKVDFFERAIFYTTSAPAPDDDED